MRVLVASKFWYRRAGLERVMLDEVAWLEGLGHEVAHFSTTHPDNQPSPYSSYFVPYFELGAAGSGSALDKARAAVRLFSNGEAARRFARLLDEFRPDIVHVHGIHRQISPSILSVTRRRDVPVVQTLHDYHHVCPADNLLRGGERVCEPPACSKLNYVPAITNRCAHGSRSVSTLSAAETWFQRARKAYEHGISRFISPSVFLAQVMARGGWTSVPCDVVPNAVPLPESTPRSSGAGCHAPSRFVFAGRLSADKGVDVLLRAAAESGTRVLIAGDGAQRAELEQLASTLGGKARSGYSAEFLGRVSGERIDELLCGAHAAVVPSVWYENAPMSVLEPMALGVPVIASRIGGIPEMVDDGVEGFLVEPGDAGALAEAMRAVAADSARAFAIGEAGRRRIAGSFSAERHMSLLLESYRAAGAPA